MSPTARDEILGRLRSALGAPPSHELPEPGTVGGTPEGEPERDGRPHPAAVGGEPYEPVGTTLPREYRVTGDDAPGSTAAVDLLAERLDDYKATVHRAADDAEVARVVGQVVGAARDAAGDGGATGPLVVPPGLDAAWLAALPEGVEVRTDSREDPLPSTELDQSLGVVTACRVAMAETGTIVLDGEPDQGRRAITLVPDLHVCVVRPEQVVQLVPEAVRRLAEHPERPQTWISGPSATSDIELERVEGVHGPRHLHVVLVTPP